MTGPKRISYAAPEREPSGMVVECADRADGWPFQASRWEVPPGATSELDVHDVAEVWFVREGTGTIASGDHVLDVAQGEMVHFAGRVPHQVTNTGTGPLRMFSVWWTP